jgi:hypothetical protein
MAVLKLTLYNVSCYEQETSDSSVTYSGTTESVSISSEKKGDTLYLNCKDDDINRDIHGYTFDMVEYKFQKKMYQPTEILAHIQINMASGETWSSIGRKRIESMFKHKQVKLEVDGDSIGWDFYVHAVLPSYKSDSMIVDLKIYSIDKVMTLDKTCHSYVGKKLGPDILQQKLLELRKPYSQNECFPTYNDRMQVLKYDRDSKNAIEHIFPYLVQYNESFYDMLIRTCNRWGEFVYWEMGQLYIGYDNSSSNKKSIPSGYKTITYPNIDKTSNLISDKNRYNNYFPVGADDSTIIDTNAKKSKWEAKAKIATVNNMWDVFWMQKASQFLGTNKDLASFFVSTVIDSLVDYAKEEAAVANKNSSHNGKFFPKPNTTDEQYGKATFKGKEDDGMNEFTEINTTYNDAKYKEILKYELKAMENIVEIDYDTTWPGLKLGEIIEKDDETFIVVEVDCEKNSDDSPVFRIVAIGSFTVTDENNNTTLKFYPAMLPTGHVRYSGPQKATVQEASSDDPCDQNRVRVAFPWQMKDQTTWVGDLSPRIRIASSDGGANMASMFYVGDSVMIGYIDGNIERPYVLGSIPKIGTVMNNVHMMSTPGGHALNLTDGSGEGFMKFILNCFTPLYNSISGWMPSWISSNVAKWQEDWQEGKYFEGGFQLTDKYGIYSISGSTDGRNVSVRSPWGDVMINAFTGINIMAPNGDINIVGKNVKIAAGNNLTLTSGTNIMNLVKNKDDNNQYVYWDTQKVISAVAEKLVQKNLQIVDVKMLRSVVEIIMRPVEGTLTLKSMRFMKLEAGTRHKCAFPKNGYKKLTTETTETAGTAIDQKKSNRNALNAENFALIKRTVNGMAAFSNKLMDDFVKKCNDMVDQRKKFEKAIETLKLLANDKSQPVCSNYNDLKDGVFWDDSAYAVLTADKLGFKEDNVGIIKDGDTDETIKGYISRGQFDTGGMSDDQKKNEALRVCSLRSIHRNKVLKEADKLRKMICDFRNFDVDDNMIKQYFKSYKYPLDYLDNSKTFQTILKESSDKSHCSNAIIYEELPDEVKKLNKHVDLKEDTKKYMRRLMIYNTLVNIGFTDETRLNTTANPAPAPDTSDQSSEGLKSLVNDSYWKQYVDSLSGVPILNKQMSGTALDKMTDTVKKASGISDADTLIQDWGEHNIWGSSDEGSLLIATDRDTYSVTGNSITKINPAEPTLKSFQQANADTDWMGYDKIKLIAFVNSLRRDLLKK